MTEPTQHADYERRPVRFFKHVIREDGQVWLTGDSVVLSAEFLDGGSHDPNRWRVVVMQYGPVQIPDQSDGCLCEPKPIEGQPHSPACRFQRGTQYDGSEGA